jgi:hypothetical protein
MSVVSDLVGTRVRGIVVSILQPMCCSSFARSRRAAALFTMIFLSVAASDLQAASGLVRHAPPASIFTQGNGIHKVSNDQSPISYFSDRMPDDADLPKAPDGTTGVVVARVRLQEAPSYLGGRDRSGEVPKNQPRDIFFARVKINDVLRGDASAGQILDVRFGQRGDKRRLIYPYTPDQRDREYVVVMYLDASDGRRRLAPFPITEFQYSQWEVEQSAYTRLRGKLGSWE